MANPSAAAVRPEGITSAVQAGMASSRHVVFGGVMVFFVIWIIAALAFFPALALGPLAEHFTLY